VLPTQRGSWAKFRKADCGRLSCVLPTSSVLELISNSKDKYHISCELIDSAISTCHNVGFSHWRSLLRPRQAEGQGFVMEDPQEISLQAMALHVFDDDGKMLDLWMLRWARVCKCGCVGQRAVALQASALHGLLEYGNLVKLWWTHGIPFELSKSELLELQLSPPQGPNARRKECHWRRVFPARLLKLKLSHGVEDRRFGGGTTRRFCLCTADFPTAACTGCQADACMGAPAWRRCGAWRTEVVHRSGAFACADHDTHSRF